MQGEILLQLIEHLEWFKRWNRQIHELFSTSNIKEMKETESKINLWLKALYKELSKPNPEH